MGGSSPFWICTSGISLWYSRIQGILFSQKRAVSGLSKLGGNRSTAASICRSLFSDRTLPIPSDKYHSISFCFNKVVCLVALVICLISSSGMKSWTCGIRYCMISSRCSRVSGMVHRTRANMVRIGSDSIGRRGGSLAPRRSCKVSGSMSSGTAASVTALGSETLDAATLRMASGP